MHWPETIQRRADPPAQPTAAEEKTHNSQFEARRQAEAQSTNKKASLTAIWLWRWTTILDTDQAKFCARKGGWR